MRLFQWTQWRSERSGFVISEIFISYFGEKSKSEFRKRITFSTGFFEGVAERD